MIVKENGYVIKIEKDNQYTWASTDNKRYDFTYFLEEFTRNDYICAYVVSVKNIDCRKTIALIGSGYGSADNCAVLKKSQLIVLVDGILVFIDLVTYELIDKINIGIEMGTGIGLYEFDKGFLINSEIEIIRTDYFVNEQWRFSGADIWVDPDGKDVLNIIDNNIYLQDFLGNEYVLDEKGQVLFYKVK